MAEETITYPIDNKRAYLDKLGLSTYDSKIKGHVSTAISEEAALLNESIDSLENTVADLSVTVTELPKKVISSISLNSSSTSSITSKNGVLNLTAGTNISLAEESNGVTITNTYVLPKAAADVLGGVKVGENLTFADDGTLSLTKNNVTGALGFTPLSASTKYAASSTVGGSANSAEKLNTNAGSLTQPIYFENGVPVATTYALNKTVPADAEFTDTKVTEVGNHYIPIKSDTYTATASSTTKAAWGSTSFITGVTLGKDAAGHITGLEVSSIQFPSLPTKSDIGLGNVENTALSTWAGSKNITTLGTITTGTWNGSAITSDYIGSHTHTIANVTGLQDALDSKSDSTHTHPYAGSLTAGGAANSANKLNTDAGNATTPVYFKDGIPAALSYTIEKSVPADALFTDTIYTHPESGVTAGSASEGGTARTLSYGGTFNIPSVTFDKYGHVTAYGKTTLTLPESDNTWRDIWVNGSSIDNATLKLAAGTHVTLSTVDGVTSISATLEGSSYTFETGTTNGTFNVTPDSGNTQPVAIYGLKALAYKDSLTYSDVGALPDTTKYITSITKSGDTLTITPSEGSAITFTGRTYSNATTSTAGLMSSSDKSKLDGIKEGAQVNVIEKVQVNGSELTITDKTVNVVVPTKTSDITNDSDYITVTEVDNKLTSAMTYKGSKDYYAVLPESNNKVGDVWNVVDYDSSKTNWGHNYAWNGTSWDDLGGNVDLSNYYTKTQSDSNYLAAGTLYAASSTKGGSASSAVKLDSSAGSTSTPVYFSSGKPTACSYSFNTTEPTTTSDDTTIPTSKAVFNAILTAVGKAIAASY